MGKKKSSAAKPAVQEAPLSAEVGDQLTTLKEQGNKFFGLTQYAKALDCYDKAVKLVPDASEKADFHVKKSACLLKLSKFKDAVKECNLALDAQPSFVNALKRRASAYEAQGLLKQALADITAVNKTEAGTSETKEAEKRLRDQMSAKSKPASNGGGAVAATRANPRPTPRSNPGLVFTAKCAYKNETRLVHMPATISYADLLTQVKNKFPESGHILLRYVDREGDLVTITQRNDIQKALAELIQSVGGLNSPAKVASLPSLKIQVVEVADPADVPRPPPEEELERQRQFTQQLQQIKKQMAQEEEKLAQQQAAQQQAQPESLEMDEWLSDLVDLFAGITGIDPFKSEQVQSLGMEEMQNGLKVALKAPEAEPILRKAGDKFLEGACASLNQVGNTHMYIATKTTEDAAIAGNVTKEALAKVAAEHDAAEGWFKKALDLKPDYWETHTQLATLSFDRSKVKAGIFAKPLSVEQHDEITALEKENPEKAHAKMNDLTAASLREALKNVNKKSLQGAKKLFDEACKHYEAALKHAQVVADAAKKAEEAKKADKEGEKKEGEKEEKAAEGDAPPPASPKDHVEVMYGNILYEWSQYLGHVGEEWKAMLDNAVVRFKSAGCSESDVMGVLRNHLMAEQMDLPKVEEKKEEEAEAKAGEEKKPEAKGLPSLEVKKKAGGK